MYVFLVYVIFLMMSYMLKLKKCLFCSQTTRAEVRIATMLVKHNIPLAVVDERTPLFQDVFSDSQIAKNFSSRRTKTCIINGAVAPHFQSILVNKMKNGPFAIATDGSGDSAPEKMNPNSAHI